jgi:hypothetical protein
LQQPFDEADWRKQSNRGTGQSSDRQDEFLGGHLTLGQLVLQSVTGVN